jgi:hypothetical protein
VTLQAMGPVALGTWRGIWVFHDGELRARQVVVARTGMLAVLLLAAVSTPRVAECDILRTLVRL